MHHLGRLLASASIVLASLAGFGASFAVTPAMAQALQTCRLALGESFSASSGSWDVRCCMVAQEKPWYDEHGVSGVKTYLTASSTKVRPTLCTTAQLDALSKGLPAPEDEPAAPPVSHSLEYGNDDEPRLLN